MKSDYQALLDKYPNKADGVFVAISMYYGLRNPEFDKRMTQYVTTDNRLGILKAKIPDAIVHTAVDGLVELRKKQAEMVINHTLNPENAKARTAWLESRIQVEEKMEQGIKDCRKILNRRLLQLCRGARYE